MICGESNSAISCSTMWSPDNSKWLKRVTENWRHCKITFNQLAKLTFAVHSFVEFIPVK